MTQKPNYAFIDSQNLNLGIRSQGWKIDYRKLRLYLKNKYNIAEAYLFIGRTSGNQDLYTALQKAGFILVFKPTVAYFEDGKRTMKGNVDAELVLYAAAKVYDKYDKAVIISGDGDFYCLAEYLNEADKLLHIMVPNKKYSRLLKGYIKHIVRLDLLRNKLEYIQGSSKKPAPAVGRNLRLSRNGSGSSGRSKP
jgi:uncharacterized LabA/DUF88 family protein